MTRHRRQRRPLPRLGPCQPPGSGDAAGAAAAADARCRCTASTATSRRMPALARERGIAAAVAPNGTMLDLTGEAPRVVEQIETGRVYLDGTVLIGAMDGVVRDRIRMATRGQCRGLGHHRRARAAARRRLGRERPACPTIRRCATASRARSRPSSAGCSAGRRSAELADDDTLDELIQRSLRAGLQRRASARSRCAR